MSWNGTTDWKPPTKAPDWNNPDPANIGNSNTFQGIFGAGKTGTGGLDKDASGRPIQPSLQGGPADNSPTATNSQWNPGTPPPIPGLSGWLDPNGPGGLGQNAFMAPDLLQGLDKNAMDGGLKVDNNALSALQGYATNPNGTMNTSASPWLNAMDSKINMQTSQMRDQAALDQQGAMGGAMSNAAMHGGLTGGAAGRIAANSQFATAGGQQAANMAGAQAHQTAAASDWQNKIGVAEGLPAAQLGLAKYNAGNAQFDTSTANQGKAMNIDNFIGGVTQGNDNAKFKYGQDVNQAIGADTAKAISQGGKKGIMG